MNYVDARLTQARLVSEQVTSLPGQMGKEVRQVQVRTETNTGLSVGLDDPINPKNMTIDLEYKVVHIVNESNQKLVEYQSKHTSLFGIVSQSGIDSWLNPPKEALAPYFSFVHGMAMRRAEHTFLDMGIRGVVLPRIEDFAKPEAEPFATIVGQSTPQT
jgi:hypothetical protein